MTRTRVSEKFRPWLKNLVYLFTHQQRELYFRRVRHPDLKGELDILINGLSDLPKDFKSLLRHPRPPT